MKNKDISKTINTAYKKISEILKTARSHAYRAINFAMVQAYWNIGRIIVEEEQKGKIRAEYGEAVLVDLSKRLSADFGKGFSVQSLWNMRKFYLVFRNLSATKREFLPVKKGKEKLQKLSALRRELTWTHYKILMRVEDEKARKWYMNEAAEQNWSTRQLDRQISTLYYERLSESRDKVIVRNEANEKLSKPESDKLIHDPYVLEFLGLKDYPDLREKTLETAIINNLHNFLLELGKGFSFVARQKRLKFDDEDFYVDLVFYNYILKCFILIDLKIGKLTHQDIGQMDSYVRMYEDHYKVKGDNPTIGLILCSKKNEAIVKYSILNESRQLFASKYQLYLPTEEELKRELNRERKIIERKK